MAQEYLKVDPREFEVTVVGLVADERGRVPHEIVFNAYHAFREQYEAAGQPVREAVLVAQAQDFVESHRRWRDHASKLEAARPSGIGHWLLERLRA